MFGRRQREVVEHTPEGGHHLVERFAVVVAHGHRLDIAVHVGIPRLGQLGGIQARELPVLRPVGGHLVGAVGKAHGHHIAVGIARRNVRSGHAFGVGLEDDADDLLPGHGRRLLVGPDGIQTVGLDADQSAVTPRAVAVEVVAHLRLRRLGLGLGFGLGHRHPTCGRRFTYRGRDGRLACTYGRHHAGIDNCHFGIGRCPHDTCTGLRLGRHLGGQRMSLSHGQLDCVGVKRNLDATLRPFAILLVTGAESKQSTGQQQRPPHHSFHKHRCFLDEYSGRELRTVGGKGAEPGLSGRVGFTIPTQIYENPARIRLQVHKLLDNRP